MKTKFSVILSLLLALVVQISFAQNKNVSGTVSDESGLPLAGATVIIEGTTTGVSTDFDGKYSILASDGDTLVYSYVGYATVSEVVAGSNVINVTMSQDNKLDEVVLLAYGSVDKQKVAGAVSVVTSETIENVPLASFDQILQGQAPGVQVFSGSGQPGAAARVRIRGNGSINGSSAPIYIVDGIQITAGDFAALNANDFASVSVLKDASATAPFGSRGANGVILITTKKGNYNQKTSVTYKTQYGITEIGDAPFEMMNSQEILEFQRIIGSGAGAGLTDAEISELAQTNTDWKDVFFRTGITQNHEIAISGGDQDSRYFTSMSYFEQDGVAERSNLQRFTLRGNFENKLSDKSKFGVNTSLGFSKSNFISSENSITLQNPFAAAYLAQPYQALRDEDGFLITGPGFVGGNSLEELLVNGNNNQQVKIIAQGFFETAVMKNISFRTDLGIDYSQDNFIDYSDPASYYGGIVTPGEEGDYGESNNYNSRITATNKLQWANVYDDVHSVDVSLFTEYYKQNFRSSSMRGYGINPLLVGYPAGITPGTPENELIPVVGGTKVVRGLFSAFAIANYDYDSKLGFSASIRRDASSKFSDENQWGTFYSLAGRWNISKEDFMKDVSYVDNLKLRASYGTAGNQAAVADYAAETQYGQLSYGGVTGIGVAAIGNPELKWETAQMFNVGVDFDLFDYKVSGSIEYYNNKTVDLFVDYTLSLTSGFSSIQNNAGSMRNAGVDVDLNVNVIDNDNFSLDVYGNFNHNKNEILDLGQVNEFESGTSIIREGLPLGSHYVVGWAGVNPANGEPLYYDGDGNVTNNYSENNSTADWGSFNPEWTGGFGLRGTLGAFDFSTLFTFAGEYYRFNNQSFFQENHNFSQFNLSTIMNTMWQQPGDVTEIQSYLYPRQFSSKDIEDASFTKWRNLTVGYTLPKKYMKGFDLFESLRIYGMVQNLKTWTNFTGFDPEDNNNIAGYEYPMPTIYTFGLNIQF
jgi:TonB-linked SusC/RagA family outer membrane protein